MWGGRLDVAAPRAGMGGGGSQGGGPADGAYRVQISGRNWAMPSAPAAPSLLGLNADSAISWAATRAGVTAAQTRPAAATSRTYAPGTGMGAPWTEVGVATPVPPNCGCRVYQSA